MREHLPELRRYLLRTIRELGLPDDFELELRGYSKTYNGLYFPDKQKVILYVRGIDGKLYSRKRLMSTLIHEAVHHYQFAHDPNYTRVKGKMHNEMFKYLYNLYYEEFINMLEEKAV